MTNVISLLTFQLFLCIRGCYKNPGHGIPLHDFKHPMTFSQNIEESCTFQKIYSVGKVKLQTKWPGRLFMPLHIIFSKYNKAKGTFFFKKDYFCIGSKL
jgi:hypothetical protein